MKILITQGKVIKKIILIFILLFLPKVFAADRVVNLIVEYKTVYFTGMARKAISVNDQIPAPTLHFKEGDHVSINVYNHLDTGTSIHWHGILVPWQMDGVEGVSQKAIPPGGVFHYQFTLRQAGTYWYHAHANVQEQEGLYGAFIIDPPTPPHYHYNKDFVVVLSDWSDTGASRILANLKKDGDYYSPRFPLQPSLMKFIHDYHNANSNEQKKLIEDYKMMQQMRMSIYDISDVAYDAYLLNGRSRYLPWTAWVKPGDVVRLRFIGAAGSTIFRVKIYDTLMQMVHVDGNDIKPQTIPDFTIAPGETYDVLVRIRKNYPYIIYAETIDTLGVAYGALITRPQQQINYKKIPPFPEPPPVTREMMDNMMMEDMQHGSMEQSSTMDMSTMPEMEHETMSHTMNMPTEPTIVGDAISSPDKKLLQITTSGTKYQNLIAAVKTNNPNKTVTGVIKMELFGYMNHFMWFINGLPEYKAKPIIIEPGKRYRIIFTNNSMMRHPMHIHGHWFILRNGHGSYDPLLHTIEVPPGATAVADIDADASGQWFFHCHHLYHMMSGMAQVFQYSTLINIVHGNASPQDYVGKPSYINRPIIREDSVIPINESLVHHPMAHPGDFYFANFFDLGEDPFNNVQKMNFKGLYGPDYNKLELFANDAELNQGNVESADLDVFYWHLLSQFWAIKGGANYFNEPAIKSYWQPGLGIEGLMPYFIDTDVRTYFHSGSAKFDLELSRDTQITNNFFIRLGIRSILATSTVIQDEVGSGLNQMRYIVRPYYRLMPGFEVFSEFEHENDYGSFKTIRRNLAESTQGDTLTFGFSLIF